MRGEKNRAMHPFSFNKITRHTVNTRPFTEHHTRRSQLRVMLAKMANCQVPPVLSRVPKSSMLFALTGGIFLQQLICKCPLRPWKLPTLPGTPTSFWGRLHCKGGHHSIACEHTIPEFQTSLNQHQRPFSQE